MSTHSGVEPTSSRKLGPALRYRIGQLAPLLDHLASTCLHPLTPLLHNGQPVNEFQWHRGERAHSVENPAHCRRIVQLGSISGVCGDQIEQPNCLASPPHQHTIVDPLPTDLTPRLLTRYVVHTTQPPTPATAHKDATQYKCQTSSQQSLINTFSSPFTQQQRRKIPWCWHVNTHAC